LFVAALAGCDLENLALPDGGGKPDGCAQPLECVGAPMGCHYQGGDGCTSCGVVVCDAGHEDASHPAPEGGADDGDADVERDAEAQRDAESEADAGADSGSAVDDAGLACGADAFPSFARDCERDDECVVVEHQINCCGSRLAHGIRADREAAFSAAEKSCEQSYPACGCAQQATVADDGSRAEGDSTARVACAQGTCSATFAVAAGGRCTAGGAPCGAGYSCCYPCGVEGCEFQCEPTCASGTPACFDGCLLRP
jgi:hypothetical protein